MKQTDQQSGNAAESAGSGLDQDLSRLAKSVHSVASKEDLLEAVARETSAPQVPPLPKEPAQFLAHLLEVLPGMAYRCANDKHWTMEYVSQASGELTGHPPEDLIDNRKVAYADLIHPEDRQTVWEAVQKAVAEKTQFHLQYRLVIPGSNGAQEKWIRERGAAVYAPSGEVVALEGFLQDYSQQRSLEESIQRLRREVNQLNLDVRGQDQDIEAFSFMCAHNLQEPLRHIRLFSQLLEKHAGKALPPLAKGHLDAVVRAAARMEHRLGDVQSLVFSTRSSMMRQTVPLQQCVEAALESLQTMVQRSEARIQVDSFPEVVGDPILLTRLFEHLLSNALQFGGPKPSVHATAKMSGPRWVFGVRDDGPGIDPRYHDRIFRPFERLNNTQSSVGNGMGLAICQSIVNRHEGKLWLWSEPGQGAHFQFVLGLTADSK